MLVNWLAGWLICCCCLYRCRYCFFILFHFYVAYRFQCLYVCMCACVCFCFCCIQYMRLREWIVIGFDIVAALAVSHTLLLFNFSVVHFCNFLFKPKKEISHRNMCVNNDKIFLFLLLLQKKKSRFWVCRWLPSLSEIINKYHIDRNVKRNNSKITKKLYIYDTYRNECDAHANVKTLCVCKSFPSHAWCIAKQMPSTQIYLFIFFCLFKLSLCYMAIKKKKKKTKFFVCLKIKYIVKCM